MKAADGGRHDDGFTLIEVLITSALLPLLVGLVGALVITAQRTDSTVRAATSAATAGQIVIDGVTTAARSADWASVSTSGTGQLLRVRTASTDTTLSWSCRAWWFDGGKIWLKSASTTIAAPTAPATQGWTLVATGVAAQETNPVFVYAAGALSVMYTVSDGSQSPVLIATTVSPRQSASGGSTQCQ